MYTDIFSCDLLKAPLCAPHPKNNTQGIAFQKHESLRVTDRKWFNVTQECWQHFHRKLFADRSGPLFFLQKGRNVHAQKKSDRSIF